MTIDDDLLDYDTWNRPVRHPRYFQRCDVAGRVHDDTDLETCSGVTHLAYYRRGLVLSTQAHPN